MVFASPRVLNTLPNIQLDLDDISKNVGVNLDSSLFMTSHINSVCKSVNFHIRSLWRIRRFLTQSSCHHAVRSLVLSRIDYANTLLYGVREVDLKRLQRLQNKAARLVFACGREQHSSDLLRSLHWLPVRSNTKSSCMFTNVFMVKLQKTSQKTSSSTMLVILKTVEGSALLLTSHAWLFLAPIKRLETIYFSMQLLSCRTNCPVTSEKQSLLRSSSGLSKRFCFPTESLL